MVTPRPRNEHRLEVDGGHRSRIEIELLRRPAWMADALCREYPDVDFFADHAAEALDVCRRCAVAGDCLMFALDERLDHGIWGGTTPRERRRLRAMTNKEKRNAPT